LLKSDALTYEITPFSPFSILAKMTYFDQKWSKIIQKNTKKA